MVTSGRIIQPSPFCPWASRMLQARQVLSLLTSLLPPSHPIHRSWAEGKQGNPHSIDLWYGIHFDGVFLSLPLQHRTREALTSCLCHTHIPFKASSCLQLIAAAFFSFPFFSGPFPLSSLQPQVSEHTSGFFWSWGPMGWQRGGTSCHLMEDGLFSEDY